MTRGRLIAMLALRLYLVAAACVLVLHGVLVVTGR
jgi:hypothetical protein